METQYKVGDDVIIYHAAESKHVYGTIKEILPESQQFSYLLHFTSNDLKDAKAEYHGKCEIIKGSAVLQEALSNIQDKVEILSLKEFIQREPPTIDNNINPFFYYRQFYEPDTKTFIPKQLPTCLCGKVVNPDTEIVTCPNKDCPQNTFYHLACLNQNSVCTECQGSLHPDEVATRQNKRKRNTDHTKLKTVSGQSQEEEEEDLQVVKKPQISLQRNKMKEMYENIKQRKAPAELVKNQSAPVSRSSPRAAQPSPATRPAAPPRVPQVTRARRKTRCTCPPRDLGLSLR